MSASNRGGSPATGLRNFIFAAAALIIAGAVSLGFYYQAEYENASRYRAAYYAADAEKQIGQTCLGVPVAQQSDCLSKASTEARLKERDNQHNEADLVAQQTSALWTSIMGIAAVIGMALSVIGVYLVWTTFKATREANEIARDTAQRQLRAYVGIEWIGVSNVVVGAEPSAELKMKNFGQTPASEFHILSFVALGSDAHEDALTIPDDATTVSGPLPPGGGYHAYPALGRKWTQQDAAALAAGKLSVFVFGEARYTDAFGAEQVTAFRVKHDKSCAPDRTHRCNGGNWAT